MSGSELTPYDYDDAPSSPPAPPSPAPSERSRAVALILSCPPFGIFGLPSFYVGRWQRGLLQLITFGGFGIWWLYDLVLIIAGDFRDADERPLRRWGVPDPSALSGAAVGEVRQLTEQLDALRNEVADLAERMDFAERMLAKQRDRDRLRPGG